MTSTSSQTHIDETMLALWLLNGVKRTHEGLYTKHMSAGPKPSLTAVLRDLEIIRLA